MKKDIQFYPVEGVTLAVVRKESGDHQEWYVYLINRNDRQLENVIVSSRGYGEKNGEPQQTSVLRHVFPSIGVGSSVLIEPIDSSVFHLSNEYWVSYYIETQVFDKKYVFVPDSILEENLSFIEELGLEGVLHP